MRKCNCHSLKAHHPLLLRRPLPPKPVCKKKLHVGSTKEIEQSYAKSSTEESALVKSDQTFPQSQRPISIQSICLDQDHNIPERVVSIFPYARGPKRVHWKIPHGASGTVFIPSCLSASSRVFRNKLHEMEKARKSKKKKERRESFYANQPFANILDLSDQFTKPLPASYSRFIESKLKHGAESQRVPKSPDYTEKLPVLRDVDEVLLSPRPSASSIVLEPQWSERPQHRPFSTVAKMVLNLGTFSTNQILPTAVLPRKPLRQIEIEQAAETGKGEHPKSPDVVVTPQRKKKPEKLVLRGEGFKTIAATRYETVLAMTTLAIINCQIYGRNALNLKGFFLRQCPDLTPLAFQLVYLNLSFNDLSEFPMEILCLKNLQILKMRNNPIREIPSEIQQLKFLRKFCIGFNLIMELPIGLFYLYYLEELDVSYNDIYTIPDEIQKLRSLEKLNVDGNFLTSFPPGILRLNLTKLQFENTFMNYHFWSENCCNVPQKLIHICSLVVVKNNLHIIFESIPRRIQKCLRSAFKCDWCHGPRFGEGLRIIRSCDMFGATQVPILFHVCSPSCYLEIKECSYILEGFPSRRIVLNLDWVKEVKVTKSFYL